MGGNFWRVKTGWEAVGGQTGSRGHFPSEAQACPHQPPSLVDTGGNNTTPVAMRPSCTGVHTRGPWCLLHGSWVVLHAENRPMEGAAAKVKAAERGRQEICILQLLGRWFHFVSVGRLAGVWGAGSVGCEGGLWGMWCRLRWW